MTQTFTPPDDGTDKPSAETVILTVTDEDGEEHEVELDMDGLKRSMDAYLGT